MAARAGIRHGFRQFDHLARPALCGQGGPQRWAIERALAGSYCERFNTCARVAAAGAIRNYTNISGDFVAPPAG